MGESLTLAGCERLIAWEARRIGAIRGYDREDVLQEGRIVAARCLERIDPNVSTGVEFVKSSLRNAFISLKRHSHSLKRCPHTSTGRRLFSDCYEVRTDSLSEHQADRILEAPQRSVEDEASTNEAIRRIRSVLGTKERFDWLMQAAVEGTSLTRRNRTLSEKERIRLRLYANAAAVAIDYRVEDKQEDGMGLYEKLPKEHQLLQLPHTLNDCHTSGTQPQGYDPNMLSPYDGPKGQVNIHLCTLCPQKYSCLAKKIDTKFGTQLPLSVDREVEAVITRDLTPDAAKLRLQKRTQLVINQEEVPAKLAHDFAGLVSSSDDEEEEVIEEEEEPEAEEPEDDEDIEVADDGDSDDESDEPAGEPAEDKPVEAAVVAKSKLNGAAHPKSVKKAKVPAPVAAAPKAKKAKAAPKPKPVKLAKPVVAKPAKVKVVKAKAAPKPAPKPKAKKRSGPTMASGKPLPAEREVTEKVMQKKLAALKLGQPEGYKFKYGQQLVRHRRVKDDDVIVVFRANGFELQLDGHKPMIFASISSCSIYAEKRIVSGNDFFNLSTHRNTELRDPKGKVLLNRSNCSWEENVTG